MKKLLNQFLLLTLPLCYMAYIIYIRLILVRTPRILYVKMSYMTIIFTLIIIFGVVLQIYALLKKEQIIKQKPITNKFLLKLQANLQSILAIFNNIWRNFYAYLVTKYFKLNLLIIGLAKYLYHNITLKRAFVILLVFEVLPKIVLVTTFLYDIFYEQQFYYFYKVLGLLLLPLIFSVIRTILLTFYSDNFENLASYIIDKEVTDETTGEVLDHYEFAFDFELPDFVVDLADFVRNHYIPVKNIIHVVAVFEEVKIDYKLNLLFIFILLLHLSGWLTILFFGITL